VIKLILFDIDGTLVLTGGAGGRAMARAASDVFGVNDVGSISMAGRTDSWIVAQIAARCGSTNGELLQRFHDVYIAHLTREIVQPGPRKGVLPGVRPLLDTLASRDDVYLALLTGNFQRGAEIKLEYFDLWRYFACGAFGDAVPERNLLLQKAIDRVVECGGPRVRPSEVLVIGDTPLDVAVAVAGGARSLGVATGPYDVATLRASGADGVAGDLSDSAVVLKALEW
jgi:phosphoglycolate phosphatase-like HAD superfamily hydrolase